MATNQLIRMNNLAKSYTVGGVKRQVLNQVSLTIDKGELVAIVGVSGSGKSTLMNIIGLLDKSDAGDYWLNQRNIAHLSQDELAILRNRHIGFVFQQFNLLQRFTVKQNVALPLIYRNTSPADIEVRVREALLSVGMQNFAGHRPTQLSGGQQQRVAIARALVGEPDVLLADEPTGALDSRTGFEVLNLFWALHATGRTIIMITHDESVAAQCARRITMVDGEILPDDRQ